MRITMYLGFVAWVLSGLAQPVFGQAQVQNFEAVIPAAASFDGGCLGETLNCEGSRLITVQLVTTPNGVVHFMNHVYDLGTTCVGSDSGAVYRANEYQTEVAFGDCDEGGCLDIATFGALYISEGSTDNLMIRGQVKLLVTPSGSLDVLDLDFSVECKG